jgi:hypothetical protein
MYIGCNSLTMTSENPARIKAYIQEKLEIFKKDEMTKEDFINLLEEMMTHEIFDEDWTMVRGWNKKAPTEVGA